MSDSNAVDTIKELAQDLLADLGVPVEAEVAERDDTVRVILSGDDLGILIGRRGETLNAFQLILGLMVQAQLGEWQPLVVDAGGYRDERAQYLRDMAIRAADQARFTARPVEMIPLSAYERRLVHTAIAEIDDISSESVGEGRERRVVVSPKGN